MMHTPSFGPGAGTPGTGCSATPGPTPTAALRAPSPCTLERAPRPGEVLEMVFNEETGQTALTRAGHDQTSAVTSHLFTCDQPLSSPYPSVFPWLFLPKSPWSLAHLTFGSTLRSYAILKCPSPAPHSVPHAPRLRPLSGYGVTQRPSPMDSWWWVCPPVPKAEALLGGPGRGSCLPGVIGASLAATMPPGSLYAADGCPSSDGLGGSGAGGDFSPTHHWSPVLLWVHAERFFITKPNIR